MLGPIPPRPPRPPYPAGLLYVGMLLSWTRMEDRDRPLTRCSPSCPQPDAVTRGPWSPPHVHRLGLSLPLGLPIHPHGSGLAPGKDLSEHVHMRPAGPCPFPGVLPPTRHGRARRTRPSSSLHSTSMSASAWADLPQRPLAGRRARNSAPIANQFQQIIVPIKHSFRHPIQVKQLHLRQGKSNKRC